MTKNPNGYTFERGTSRQRADKILQALAQPRTRHELTGLVHASLPTVQIYLSALLAAKAIHITDWRRNSPGSPTPVYLAGRGVNKARPKVKSPAERARSYRQRNPERVIADIERLRLARMKPRRDSLTSALYGAAA